MPTSTVCCSFLQRYIDTQKSIEHAFESGIPNSRYFSGILSIFGTPSTSSRYATVTAYKIANPAERLNSSVMSRTKPTVVPQKTGAVRPMQVAFAELFTISKNFDMLARKANLSIHITALFRGEKRRPKTT